MTRPVAALRPRTPDVAALLTQGIIAGLAAACLTSLFQKACAHLDLSPAPTCPPTPPPTEKLANDLAIFLKAQPLGADAIGPTGALVHFTMGAGLGAGYAQLKQEWPAVGAARGAAFGLGIWATVEELGLALANLKPPPWEVKPAEHIFAASSHMIFGIALDAALKRIAALAL